MKRKMVAILLAGMLAVGAFPVCAAGPNDLGRTMDEMRNPDASQVVTLSDLEFKKKLNEILSREDPAGVQRPADADITVSEMERITSISWIRT